MLKRAYEVFQVEVGLSGNIFEVSFESYGGYATMGWFAHFWQLCDLFDVKFRIAAEFNIPMLREDARPLMDVISELGIFSIAE